MAARTIGVDAKIARGEHHLLELEAEVGRFFQSEPYGIFVYCELDSRQICYAVSVSGQPSPLISVIAGDVINCLRSSLDYVMCELFEANGQPVDDQVFFPIAWNAKQFKAKLPDIEKGAGKHAAKILESIEAYKGGTGHRLWQLHQLNIRDKHRLLVPVGSAHQAVSIDFGKIMGQSFPDFFEGEIPSAEVAIRPADRQYPLTDGAVLFGIPSSIDPRHMDMNPKFTFDLAIGEGKVMTGEPIGPALHGFVDLVKGTVDQFRPLLL